MAYNYIERKAREPFNDGATHVRFWLRPPQVEKQEKLHFILKLIDKGTPALSRYKRVIVTVLP